MLKIDIEGAEIDLLKSIPDSILSSIRQMTVEFHDFQFDIADQVELIKKKLEMLGFFYVVFSMANHGDVLFINKNLCKVTFLSMFYLKYLARYCEGFYRITKRFLE